MLTDEDTAAPVAGQRTFVCRDCGQLTSQSSETSHNQQMCVPCRKTAKMERERRGYYQRKAAKGPTMLTCANCHAEVTRTNPNQKVCEDCRGKWGNSRPRVPVPVIGAPFVCGRCGEETIRTGAHQKVCGDCRHASRLEYAAEYAAAAVAARAAEQLAGPRPQTQCNACGVLVAARFAQGRWYPKAYCDVCAAARKKEQTREGLARLRRKAGIPVVKGTLITCACCGEECTRNGPARKFCDSCAAVDRLERARARVNRLSRERGAVMVGSTLDCRHCSASFVSTAVHQVMCSACRALNQAGKLPHLRVAIAKNNRLRHATDPKFAMNNRMRWGIRNSLVAGGKAGKPWESLVGYTVVDLMRHLERCFLPGMTWENRGEWEIDHITPLALFDFTGPEHPEFKAAWALPNLRPLWKADNYEKRAKRLYLL